MSPFYRLAHRAEYAFQSIGAGNGRLLDWMHLANGDDNPNLATGYVAFDQLHLLDQLKKSHSLNYLVQYFLDHSHVREQGDLGVGMEEWKIPIPLTMMNADSRTREVEIKVTENAVAKIMSLGADADGDLEIVENKDLGGSPYYDATSLPFASTTLAILPTAGMSQLQQIPFNEAGIEAKKIKDKSAFAFLIETKRDVFKNGGEFMLKISKIANGNIPAAMIELVGAVLASELGYGPRVFDCWLCTEGDGLKQWQSFLKHSRFTLYYCMIMNKLSEHTMSLADFFRKTSDDQLLLACARAVFKSIADMHSLQILHRNLTLDNIFVRLDQATHRRSWLVDFGQMIISPSPLTQEQKGKDAKLVLDAFYSAIKNMGPEVAKELRISIYQY